MKKTMTVSLMTVCCMLVLLLGLGSPAPIKVNAPGGQNGLSDQEASVAPPQQPVQLHISVSALPKTLSLFEEATDAFMRRNPHIEVLLDNVTEQQAFDKYAELNSLGLAPDVMLLNVAWVYDYASEGRLRALDDLIAVENQNGWFDSVLQSVKWNGYIWAVPLYWDPYVILYNGDVISADPSGAGFPADLYGWFEQHGMPVLTGADEAVYRLVLDELKETENITDEAAGQDNAAAPNEETEAAFFEGVVEALATEREKQPVSPQAAIESLTTGKAEWSLIRLSEAMKFSGASEPGGPRLSMTPVPFTTNGKERTAPPHFGQCFVVSAISQHPEEAAGWISYMTDYITSQTASGYDGFSVVKRAYDVPPAASEPSSSVMHEYGFPLSGVTAANLGLLLGTIDFAQSSSGEVPPEEEEPSGPIRLPEEELLQPQ